MTAIMFRFEVLTLSKILIIRKFSSRSFLNTFFFPLFGILFTKAGTSVQTSTITRLPTRLTDGMDALPFGVKCSSIGDGGHQQKRENKQTRKQKRGVAKHGVLLLDEEGTKEHTQQRRSI